jgi:hypothetical protein
MNHEKKEKKAEQKKQNEERKQTIEALKIRNHDFTTPNDEKRPSSLMNPATFSFILFHSCISCLPYLCCHSHGPRRRRVTVREIRVQMTSTSRRLSTQSPMASWQTAKQLYLSSCSLLWTVSLLPKSFHLSYFDSAY